ncbi:MAG TPA: MarR family transcriptional regulator, partial [Spirochaetia bacterium]|nr:MarR family transcriptional regulator [Spirochaetia bacterium]
MENNRIIELIGMITRRMVRQLAPIAEAEELSMTEVLVLWKMNRKRSCRVSEIAEEIGASPSTFTGVLDRLVAAKWLTREPDPLDRRAVLVRATQAVGPLLDRMLAQSEGKLAELFEGFGKVRLERLVGDL